MDDELRSIIIFAVGGIIFIVGVAIGIAWIDSTFIDNVPSVVKVDGKVVYEGTSAGFDLESSGANTTVTIRGGFLYIFPIAYYTSKDVDVFGKK